jgi:hypothetical protein
VRLKLDLHPIFNDSRRIEEALQNIVEEAVAKRAKEVEIIPGKGSGALKKTVIRFLQRPDVKSRYHRLEKDSDNWGRLFIHFRHDRADPATSFPSSPDTISVSAPCACCEATMQMDIPEDESAGSEIAECPACGSPNRLTFRKDRRGEFRTHAELAYDE